MADDVAPIKVPIPEHITMEQVPGGTAFSYPWFSMSYVFMAVFALFWDGFLVFWYSIAVSQDAPLIMFIFPGVHLLVGVGITYSALCGFYNKTVVTVGQGKLSIQHGPLPWPGNKIIDSSSLTQLYSEERIVRSRNGTQVRYQLSAIANDNRKIKLLSNLNTPDEVRYLEEKLEEQLGIKDRPVEGELKR